MVASKLWDLTEKEKEKEKKRLRGGISIQLYVVCGKIKDGWFPCGWKSLSFRMGIKCDALVRVQDCHDKTNDLPACWDSTCDTVRCEAYAIWISYSYVVDRAFFFLGDGAWLCHEMIQVRATIVGNLHLYLSREMGYVRLPKIID